MRWDQDNKNYLQRKRVMKQESRANTKLISTDAPPLDFSFRNIKQLEDILTMHPQSGHRKSIIAPSEEIKKTVRTQQSNVPEQKVQIQVQEQLPQKQVQTRLQIVRTVDVANIVHQSNQSNNLAKIKNQITKTQKKTKTIQLITSTLYLSYNKLRTIKGFYNVINSVFPDIKNLKWIDLSHNYIVVLQYDFVDFPWLRTLYLHSNYIKDYGELLKLQHLKELKTFTIHGNPLDLFPQFRMLVIGLIPQLVKIDSVLVTKREYDSAFHYAKSINPKKLPIVTHAEEPNIQSSDDEN